MYIYAYLQKKKWLTAPAEACSPNRRQALEFQGGDYILRIFIPPFLKNKVKYINRSIKWQENNRADESRQSPNNLKPIKSKRLFEAKIIYKCNV